MSDDANDAGLERLRARLFWRIHGGLPKQGPGSDASTRRALAAVGPLPERPRILDLGCGPGRQTVVLAQETGGDVIAVDLLPPFLEQVEERVARAGLSDRVRTRSVSMGALPVDEFPEGGFDLVWSEGAIYNLGFEAGLRAWRPLLRSPGWIAVTEATWLGPDPSERVRRFWDAEYPEMGGVDANIARLERAGFRLEDHFALPPSEWWDDYYTLIESRVETLREEETSREAARVIAEYDEELAVVREGLETFGYVFYVMRPT